MAKGGGVSHNPPVVENFGKKPLSGEAGPPSARLARRQIFRVFKGFFAKNLGFFPKFWGFFGIFGEFSLNLTGS